MIGFIGERTLGVSQQLATRNSEPKTVGKPVSQAYATFRDLKSPAYGLGLRQSHTNSPERFDIILLIALMVQCLLWLVRLHVQQQGWDRHFQANTALYRTALSTIRLGLAALRRPDYLVTEKEQLAAWVSFANQLLKYGYAMADL